MLQSNWLCFIFLLKPLLLLVQNEIGPEGYKLFWIFLVVLVLGIVLFSKKGFSSNKSQRARNPFFHHKKVKVSIAKDKPLFPENLTLSVKNTGKVDIDLDQPLLVFDRFWFKRKFKIKGTGNHCFYPLFLEKGKTHELKIELTRFYLHDKKLKKYPKIIIHISDINGKRLGRKTIFVRKTLFRH